MAGIMIGIAGCANLGCGGGLPGAVIFAFGLLAVVAWQLDLFTGRSGFWSGRDIWRLIPVLLLNISGVVFVALISQATKDASLSLAVTAKRLAADPFNLFLLSAMCGLIMTTAVKFAKQGNWWPLLFGVPTFIMCGFPHCIADIYYWTVALLHGASFAEILPVYLVTVAGNYAGCNMPRLIPGFIPNPPAAAVAKSLPEEEEAQ